MIGMTIIVSIVFILIIFALIVLLRELINTIRNYGIGKLEVFFIAVLIVLMVGVVLHSFGI